MVELIAHRGASCEEPENTLNSILRAIDIGVDFIELDVHLSMDHVPVVIHDHTLCRTTNAEKGRRVRRSILEYMKQLDAGSWFRGKKTEVQIPSLEEILKLPLGETGLMIELKEDIQHDLSKAVVELLNRYPVKKLILGSFSHITLEYLKTHYPQLPLIGIADQFEQIQIFQNLPIKHFAVDHQLIQGKYVSEKFNGSKVWAFTVDDYHVAQRLIALGIEGIITNNPRAIKPLIHVNAGLT